LIRLTTPDGKTIVEREYSDADSRHSVPDWFVHLIPLSAQPGVAQVQDGWRQYGTLTVLSHSRYAYEALWDGRIALLAWFVIGGLLTGGVGTLIIRAVTHPLQEVVEQAEAIGNRRFVTIPEPGTSEFRSVVRAMNALSARIRRMLTDETARLEQLRRQSQHDTLTDLANRTQFMNQFGAALSREDAHASGYLFLARIINLATLNKEIGRAATDNLLLQFAQPLKAWREHHPESEAGRINASDLALLAPGSVDIESSAEALSAELRQSVSGHPGADHMHLAFAATSYHAGQPQAQVLARLDAALAAAELRGGQTLQIADDDSPVLHTDLAAWRKDITHSLDGDGFRLASYPVLGKDGQLLHLEAPARLRLADAWQSAGVFMPWISRLGLHARLDLTVARAALALIRESDNPVGINLSTESICEAEFRQALRSELAASPDVVGRLWIDLPEPAALRHPGEFRALCDSLRILGCRLGIEHIDTRFSELHDLHELGLDYLKVDASIIRNIDSDIGNQNFLRGLALIAHSIGLMTIGEGVETEAEKETLFALGIDGATGKVIPNPRG
jgi:EAL domain-containing protein (putative c-di-GMP-specific phosphodiesterase class I)/GGDEF domain-containing protein